MTLGPSDFAFGVLGPLQALRRGMPVRLGGAKQRALLASLLLRANDVVLRDQLIEDLWGPHPPATASKAVQVYVSRLRRALFGGELATIVETIGDAYRLAVDPEQFDLTRFERFVEAARRAQVSVGPAAASSLLNDALALWRGPALADIRQEPVAQAEAPWIDSLRVKAIEQRIDADLALGREREVADELQLLVAEHRYHERFHAQLMLALYRSGHQAEALAAFRRAQVELSHGLGIEPSPSLRRLERAILRQDVELERQGDPKEQDDNASAIKRVTVLNATVGDPGKKSIDPERLRRALRSLNDAAAAAAARHDAQLEVAPDGSAILWFGLRQLHEDDALRAARAAIELLQEPMPGGFLVRAGIESGPVVTADASTSAPVGEPIAAADRLQQVAAPGTIVIGGETRRAIADDGRVERVRDGVPGTVWKLVGLREGGRASRLTPLIGRERELNFLWAIVRRVSAERRGQLLLIVGSPGVGKSRVATELVTSLQAGTLVLQGRCPSYGDGVTFWPLREVLEQAVGANIHSGVEAIAGTATADRIRTLIEASGRLTDRSEAFAAVRQLFLALARERPVLLVVEDLHCAEQMLLDLLDALSTLDGPLLTIGVGRPELRTTAATWFDSGRAVIVLEPLSPDETAVLVDKLGATTLAPRLRSRVIEASEGNPLFAEHLVRAALESGDWASALDLPPTIYGLLGARLDELDADARSAIECAAVIGVDFAESDLFGLLDQRLQPRKSDLLVSLASGGLITPLGRKRAYRFAHQLIRDVAYASMTREKLRQRHEKYAHWLEQTSRRERPFHPAVVAQHYEQAARASFDLDGSTESGRELSRCAGRWFALAAREAYERDDAHAAAKLFRRAIQHAVGQSRASMLTDYGEVLRELGQFEDARNVLEEALADADGDGESALTWRARMELLRTRMRMEGGLASELISAEAERALKALENTDEHRALAVAWRISAFAPWDEGKVGESERALEQAIRHARRARDARTEELSINLLLGAGVLGPRPVPEAIERAELARAKAAEGSLLYADACRALGWLRAMQGDFEAAREFVTRDKAALTELNLDISLAASAEVYGSVELLADQPDLAEAEFRAGLDALSRMGEKRMLTELALRLALVLATQEQADEASRLVRVTAGQIAKEEPVTQMLRRQVRAQLAADRGQWPRARKHARDAVSLVAATELVVFRADALLLAARIHQAAGTAFADLARQARELYAAKGHLVGVAQAQALVSETD